MDDGFDHRDHRTTGLNSEGMLRIEDDDFLVNINRKP
jgi:hypothetical protein